VLAVAKLVVKDKLLEAAAKVDKALEEVLIEDVERTDFGPNPTNYSHGFSVVFNQP